MKKEDVNIESYEQRLKLELVKRILNNNAFVHIGGSVALYIHGIFLKRIADGSTNVDFDICGAFYMPLMGDPTDKIIVAEDVSRASDADYKEVLTFNGTKVDYAIRPAERFEYIIVNDYPYRVTPLEIIMEAKFRYAMKGNAKQRNDCYEICGKFIPPVKEDTDLPF